MEATEVLTIGGASVITVILSEAIKKALRLSEANTDRFGLLLALAIGIGTVAVFNLLAIANTAVPWGTAILVGILAGASAAGIYGGTKAASPTGIMRQGVVIAPLNKEMRFGGWANGDGQVWARARLGGAYRFIRKDLIHFV
jgi:xanthine/uracil permease